MIHVDLHTAAHYHQLGTVLSVIFHRLRYDVMHIRCFFNEGVITSVHTHGYLGCVTIKQHNFIFHSTWLRVCFPFCYSVAAMSR